MVLQWATKRLCKFFLKRLNRFLNDEIDVEQLDVQLGNGIGRLTDLVLNVDYINDQVKCGPFILKYGAISRIVVKLPCEVELEGLELLVAPRPIDQPAETRQAIGTNAASCSPHSGNDAGATGNCTYLGVNDGVRMIGQMLKNLLLGLRVKVTTITIAIEGDADSQDYLTLQIPHLEYGYEDPKEPGDSTSLTKLIKFGNASLDVGVEKRHLLGENGISGFIRVSIPCIEGAAACPKINFELSMDSVQFTASFDELERLMSLVYSYIECRGAAQDQSVYHDIQSSFYESAMQGQRSIFGDSKASDSVTSAGKSSLPVIADWMRKPELSEPDLAASMDEFFECFEAWQSASSSGLWNWTCSAIGATSMSASATGTSQEIQLEYSLTTRVESVCATLLYDTMVGEGLELALKEIIVNVLVSQEEVRADAQINGLDAIQLCPSPSQKQCFRQISQTLLPRASVDFRGLPYNGTRGLKLLSIMPTSSRPAASLQTKHYYSSVEKSKVAISLQPLGLWLDIDVLERLSHHLARLRPPREHDIPAPSSEKDVKHDWKFSISIPYMRTYLSAANHEKSGCMLAVDLGGGGNSVLAYEQQNEIRSLTFTATDGLLYSIRGTSAAEVIRAGCDNQGKVCVDMKWTDNNKTGPWVAKKVWDSSVVQNKYSGSGRNTPEFASATVLGSDSGSSAVELVKATSSLKISFSVPRLRFDFSKDDHGALFSLVSHLASSSNCEGNDKQATQTVISFAAREVEAVADVSAFMPSAESAVSKGYNLLQLRISKLKTIFGVCIGGDATASSIHVSHGDCSVLAVNCDTELLSCRASVVGRGDGGARNALSTGTAGLTLNVVSWPKKEQMADLLVTGYMNGTTIVTEGGQFDWVPAVAKFFEHCSKPFEKADQDLPAEGSKRSCFVFDFQDIALCYEPVPIDEAQRCSSIACVLAAAAFRVSSSEVAVNGTEHYNISLRDLALHLVDKQSRNAGGSLQQRGYVQVAKAPVIGALVKVSGTESPSWEVESTDTQLYFDTCSDTTIAFGRLVADLQRLFAPDIQQSAAELQLRTTKGKSADIDEVCPGEASTSEERQTSLGSADGLFEGVVENAFTCAKVLELKKVQVAGCSTSTRETTVSRHETTTHIVEDYYLMEHLMEHVSHESSGSSQECETSRQSTPTDLEPKGGWYLDSPVDVFDAHVPIEKESPRTRTKRPSGLDYPQPVGRVTLIGWKVRWRLYGGSDWTPSENARQKDQCVEVSVVGMDVHYDAFAPTGLYASSLLVEIHDVHVYDCSVDAPWKLILGYYQKKSRPRESTSKAVKVRMDAVRPNPTAPLEEYRLSLALLPICLHLDQAHTEFFAKFFQPLGSDKDDPAACSNANDDTILPFFQVCEMRPLIIRVDYIPRHVDFTALRGGNCLELFNMVSWKGVELHLKHVHTSGVYGWSSLMGLLLGEWLQDISHHQLHKFVRAFGPIRPLCAVSSGAAKLIVFPAEQYKKDRRFLRGMRRGAVAFLQSISLEALGLGANLAAGAHHILLHTEMALGGNLPSDKKEARRKSQPSDTREGLQQAYESIAHGLERSAVSLLGNPVKVYQRGGGAGVAVASAIKASPTALLAPASAAADAMRHALLGVRNGLDPERKREYDEKHRGPLADVKRWS